MAYFFRNAFMHSTPERQEVLRKSEQQRAQRDFQPLDSLSTSASPDRGPLTGYREVALAKMEAEEARKEAVLKHEADHAATLGKNYTLRDHPTPTAKADDGPLLVHTGTPLPANQQGKPRVNKLVSAPGDDDYDEITGSCTKLDAITKSMKALVAEHQALMAKINWQGDDTADADDDDGADPTTGPVQDTKPRQPNASNRVHEPNPDGVYAKQDRRTVTSTHHVNRKAKGVPVAKGEHVYGGGSVRLVNAAGLDLSSMFTGVQLKPV